jgi:metal-responsive CopG/Arc/MetJ family transcriptional regulator
VTAKKRDDEKNKSIDSDATTLRASISFPREDYDQLEGIAREKRVSLAWVVREAVRIYLEKQRSDGKAGS